MVLSELTWIRQNILDDNLMYADLSAIIFAIILNMMKQLALIILKNWKTIFIWQKDIMNNSCFVIMLKPCTRRQGKTKVEVAKMIQATKDNVVIKYNKLHADPKQGDTHCTYKKKNSTWCCLKYPSLSCCSTRQNAGSHPEEGETQDGWQIQIQGGFF